MSFTRLCQSQGTGAGGRNRSPRPQQGPSHQQVSLCWRWLAFGLQSNSFAETRKMSKCFAKKRFGQMLINLQTFPSDGYMIMLEYGFVRQ